MPATQQQSLLGHGGESASIYVKSPVGLLWQQCFTLAEVFHLRAGSLCHILGATWFGLQSAEKRSEAARLSR